MKIFAQLSNTSKTGYELRTVYDDGHEEITPIDKHHTSPKEPNTLILPKNEFGRQFVSSLSIDKAGGSYELKYHEPRENTGSYNKKPLEDYLEGEDKVMYLALIEKAKAAREAASKKPLTDIEKAQKAVERAMAKLAELQALENM